MPSRAASLARGQRCNTRMIERGERPRFALEPGEPIGIVPRNLEDELDGDSRARAWHPGHETLRPSRLCPERARRFRSDPSRAPEDRGMEVADYNVAAHASCSSGRT